MSQNNTKIIDREVLDFLTESEIRQIVRKRLMKDTEYRLGSVSYLSLSRNNNNVLSESAVSDVIDAVKNELSGARADTWNSALKATLSVTSLIVGVKGTALVMGLPFFVPMQAKLIMVGALGAGLYALNKVLYPLIDNATTGASLDKVFLLSQSNPVNDILVKLRQAITVDGSIKMPRINPPVSYNPTDSPATCHNQLQNVVSAMEPIGDFLGVPHADFTGPGTSSPLKLDCVGFSYPANYGDCRLAAQNMIRVLENDDEDIVEKILDIVARYAVSPDVSLYDLQFLDAEFGKLVTNFLDSGTTTNGNTPICGRSTADLVLDPPPVTFGVASDVVFISRRTKIDAIINDNEKSNILHLIPELNVSANVVGGNIPSPIQSLVTGAVNWTPELTGTYLRDAGVIPENFHKDRMFMLPIDMTSGILDSFLFNKPLTDLIPAHGKMHSNGFDCLIGKDFFKELELDLFQRAMAILQPIFDWCWTKVQAAGHWVGDRLDDLRDWWDTTGLPGLSDIGRFLSGGLSAVWNWVSGLVNSFLSFMGISGGGSSATPSTTSGGSGGSGSSRYRSEVEEMQRLMNKINNEQRLGAADISVDGYWGTETDGMWQLVTNYAFDQGILKDDPDAATYKSGMHNWMPMSADLRDGNGTDYPNYTADPTGALNIIKDIDSGSTNSGIATTQAPSPEEGETDISAEEPPAEETSGAPTTAQPVRGGVGVRGIRIRVDAGNNNFKTFESLGFPAGTTMNVTEDVLASIRSENYTGTKEEGLQLKISISRGGKISNVRTLLDPISITTSVLEIIPFFNSLTSKIRRTLKSTPKIEGLRDKVTSSGGRAFTISITIPPGAARQR